MINVDWNAFISSLGGTAVGGAAVGALFMVFVKHRLKLAKERFKAELSALGAERQTRFTYLHQTQTQVIAKLYEKIVSIHQALSLIDTYRKRKPEEQIPQELQAVIQKHLRIARTNIFQLMEFINVNKLYFPATLVDALHAIELLTLQRMMWMEEEITAENATKIEAELSKLDTAFEPALREIETLFRNLLGSS